MSAVRRMPPPEMMAWIRANPRGTDTAQLRHSEYDGVDQRDVDRYNAAVGGRSGGGEASPAPAPAPAAGFSEAMAAFLSQGGSIRTDKRGKRFMGKGPLKGKTLDQGVEMAKRMWAGTSDGVREKYASRAGEGRFAPSELVRVPPSGGNALTQTPAAGNAGENPAAGTPTEDPVAIGTDEERERVAGLLAEGTDFQTADAGGGMAAAVGMQGRAGRGLQTGRLKTGGLGQKASGGWTQNHVRTMEVQNREREQAARDAGHGDELDARNAEREQRRVSQAAEIQAEAQRRRDEGIRNRAGLPPAAPAQAPAAPPEQTAAPAPSNPTAFQNDAFEDEAPAPPADDLAAAAFKAGYVGGNAVERFQRDGAPQVFTPPINLARPTPPQPTSSPRAMAAARAEAALRPGVQRQIGAAAIDRPRAAPQTAGYQEELAKRRAAYQSSFSSGSQEGHMAALDAMRSHMQGGTSMDRAVATGNQLRMAGGIDFPAVGGVRTSRRPLHRR